ncbi:MAG: hypothetical protein K2L56_10785 [Prevotella sp.]|nr:hypothetical protein [Prevotella sp.]
MVCVSASRGGISDKTGKSGRQPQGFTSWLFYFEESPEGAEIEERGLRNAFGDEARAEDYSVSTLLEKQSSLPGKHCFLPGKTKYYTT